MKIKKLLKLGTLLLLIFSLFLNNPTGYLANTSISNENLEIGMNDPSVATLKDQLYILGFWSSKTGNSQYGPQTERAVRNFQSAYGLEETGIADASTREKLLNSAEGPLKNPMYRDDVIILKENLENLGFGSFNLTDYYGPQTERAVRNFQSAHGLEETGVVDTATKELLENATAGPLRNPMYRDDAIELKENLEHLGFGSFNLTNYYGPQTERAVREFQAYFGLSVDGIAGPQTVEKLEEVANTPLQSGRRHSDTKKLKDQLYVLGYWSSKTGNSQYGPQTERAVRRFQSAYGLRETGIGDPVTLARLERESTAPLKAPMYRDDAIRLKENLEHLGFGSFNLTDYYGPQTERAVREFQTYYGLSVDGIAGPNTVGKLEEIATTPLQTGKSHSDTRTLKDQLYVLGYWSSKTGNSQYGPQTERAVRRFQSDHGLREIGIADPVTLERLKRESTAPLSNPMYRDDAIELKYILEKLGFGSFIKTDYYGPQTERAVRNFQEEYNLPVNGIVDELTKEILNLADQGIKHTNYNITLDQAVDIQMRVRPQTDLNYAYVSVDYIDSDNRVSVNTSLNVRSGPSTSNSKVIGSLVNGTKINIISEVNGFYQIQFPTSSWGDAARADVKYYLNPKNFEIDEKQRFQFLDLSRPSGADKSLLDAYLSGKGILDGHGQSFIDASEIHGVNDVYLISHALLETGNGYSALSTGVEVGKNESGDLVLVDEDNRSELKDIETTYNMYGIGAVDNNAHEGGAFRAYKNGWFTPKDAIIGGARFIGNNYVKNGQNTLYKMRWNPDAMASNGRAAHQYATDIGWASKQILNMYNMYRDIGITIVYLDIPQYSN